MAKIVNLNQYRKARERIERSARAGANRTKHGRTKAERRQDEQVNSRQETELSGKRLEKDEGDED